MGDADFTLEDLAIAYRKAKVDLYYGSTPRHLDIALYENNLADNLAYLKERLNSDSGLSWIDSQFVGELRLAPKSVDYSTLSEHDLEPTQQRIYSSPLDQWKALTNHSKIGDGQGSKDAGIQASFRLISNCSIAMHVIGALWVREVGVYLDGTLSDAVRGYRVRRDRKDRYNDWSLGTFEPYLWPYKKWRDDGFNALEKALETDKNVYCMVADATEFFHRIDPRFLSSDSGFFDLLRPKFDEKEFFSRARKARIHTVFLKALLEWQAQQSSILKEWDISVRATGLPVGFPASGVVANLALLEFDRLIKTQIRPLHYGRYVDDIILVWEDQSASENDQKLNSVTAAWDWIASKFPTNAAEETVLSRVPANNPTESPRFRFQPDYHWASRIDFSNHKNRLYSMQGSTGKNLLKTLRAAADQNSSEWRMMPELPYAASDVGALVSRARNVDGDSADNLTNFEGISMSRSAFALTLRNFESFARDIESRSWVKQRHAFYRAVCDYVFVPSMVFDMDRYVTRILSLALSCGDMKEFEELLETFIAASGAIEEVSAFSVAGIGDGKNESHRDDTINNLVRSKWLAHIEETIYSAIHRSLRKIPSQLRKRVLNNLRELDETWSVSSTFLLAVQYSSTNEGFTLTERGAIEAFGHQNLAEELFYRDLAGPAFRYSLLPQHSAPALEFDEVQPFESETSPLSLFQESIAAEQIVAFLNLLAKHKKIYKSRRDKNQPESAATGLGRIHSLIRDDGGKEAIDLYSLWALLFPTRPFSASELFDLSNILRVANDEVESIATLLRQALLVARGLGVHESVLIGIRPKTKDDRHVIALSTEYPSDDGTEGKSKPFDAYHVDDPPVKAPSISKEGKVRVAVSMLKTPKDFVTAAIHRRPDLSAQRYNAVSRLVNLALKLHPKPDYLVLGELALPLQWYNHIAMKLAASKISLIAGVEYIHADSSNSESPRVRNQVWASLRHSTLRYPTHSTYKQDKLVAAHGERQNLVSEANARIEPEFRWQAPPIVSHDGHSFGILICSELTNIENRASFRGKIDTLFVPQWNKDLNTFTALVESASLDIHAYIVQVNNRMFGDTRIRVPAGDEPWMRDLVQLKGGLNDYLVVGELDIKSMRIFQTKYSSPSSSFKPLPDGYDQDPTRKMLY